LLEWIYEQGVGETRAALTENGAILEAILEWDDCPWPVGTIVDARLAEMDRSRNQAFIVLPDGSPAILTPLPVQATSQGQAIRVEVSREPIAERDRRKWPKVRPATPEATPGVGPSLLERLNQTGLPVVMRSAHEADILESSGWSELLEDAVTGKVAFPGGDLHVSMTPAMTLIDVDGTLSRAELAVAGAGAAARAIRRFAITGSIGIDLPTVDSKAVRNAAAAAIDAILPPPFERTAVNGYGFVQIIRRRARRSLLEMLAEDPDGAAARALLRRAERSSGSGALTVIAAPPVIDRLDKEQAWRDELCRRTGRPLSLQPQAGMARWGGDVKTQYP